MKPRVSARRLLMLYLQYGTRGAAHKTGLSPTAVYSRLWRLRRKLDAEDMVQLVHYCHCLGILKKSDLPPKVRAEVDERGNIRVKGEKT